jgi:benzoate-CoA ligase family protein
MMTKGPDIDFSIPQQLNLTTYFLEDNIAAGRGEKVALYCQDERYTFNDICRLTNKVGNVLQELGVEPENRVLLILQDSPEWIASWYATMKIGGVGTHAYTYLSPGDYEYFVNYVRPKVIVADYTTLDGVREGMKNTRYPVNILVVGAPLAKLKKREYDFYSLVNTATDYLETEPTHCDDIAFWNFSGGTTGKPKGVPHTHRDGVISYQSFQYIVNYTEDDLVLRVPKLFFHYARDLGMNYVLRIGGAVVLFPERSTAKLLFELIERFKPSVLLNVPTMMRAMLQTPKPERGNLSSLRLCLSSGEVLSAQLYREWMENFAIEVVNRIGSAESGAGYLTNTPGKVVPGSSGRVAPLVEVKVVDNEGYEVQKGEPGVLMVHCDAAGLYYERDHEKSKRTFAGDDWVNTGDLFREDEEGNFWYMGRADELVKISGVWVSLLEIEGCLQEYPVVRECVVLGLEDTDGLTKSKAFIALHEGAEASEHMRNELIEFCKRKLSPYKYPRFIDFMSELPKTGQGKIDKRQLRELGL